ncbi:MAG: hypothetical protein V1696_01735 [Candidatus Jorgensenbacteria bacterium]
MKKLKQHFSVDWKDPHEVASAVFAVFLLLLGVVVLLGGSGAVDGASRSFTASLFSTLGFFGK